MLDRIKTKIPQRISLEMLVRYAMLAGVFALLCFFVGRYIQYNLDSDMSSELLMSRILADEGKLISSSWLYSTELEVLDVQLFFIPFFALGIESWHTVRVLGTITMYALLVLSLWFFCRSADLQKSFPLIGVMLLLPLSDAYSYVMFGTYYVPHITLSFVCLGILFRQEKGGRPGTLITLQILNMLLALGAGMGGMRRLFVLYMPLVMAAALELWLGKQERKDFSLFWRSLLLLFSAGVGFLINNFVLAKVVFFSRYGTLKLNGFSLEGLEKILGSCLELLGLEKNTPLFSAAGLCGLNSLLLVFAVVLACIHVLRFRGKYSRWIVLTTYFFLANLLIFFCIYSLTNMSYIPRHLMPALVFVFPVVVAAFDKGDEAKPMEKAFLILVMVALLFCNAWKYNDMRQKDHTVNLRAAGEELLELGYEEGYAGFWKANVLTELTDGKIEVWHWAEWKENKFVLKWLQASSHLDTPPEGKVFLLLTETEEEESELPEQLEEYFLFRTQYYDRLGTDNYVAYGFDSREEMLAVLGK